MQDLIAVCSIFPAKLAVVDVFAGCPFHALGELSFLHVGSSFLHLVWLLLALDVLVSCTWSLFFTLGIFGFRLQVGVVVVLHLVPSVFYFVTLCVTL